MLRCLYQSVSSFSEGAGATPGGERVSWAAAGLGARHPLAPPTPLPHRRLHHRRGEVRATQPRGESVTPKAQSSPPPPLLLHTH